MRKNLLLSIALLFILGKSYAQITFTVTVTDPTMCTNPNCDGMGVVSSVAGGTPPYTYQWVLPFIHQYNDTALYICPGTWQVIVYDSTGSYSSQNITFTCNTANGINPVEKEERIRVFPSLALNEINVEMDAMQGPVELVIRNILGDVVYSEAFSVNGKLLKEVNISGLPAGIYTLEFAHNAGRVSTKFVKQ